MPRIGTSSANTCPGARGESASTTDSGPPERITPFGANFAISPGSWSHAQISQYTPISRIRRAISCVYCDPKSRMRILSVWMSCIRESGTGSRESSKAGRGNRFPILDSPFPALSAEPVIRRFLGDLHIVHVRFAHTGAGDAHELRLLAHLFDIRAPAIAHRCAQTAHQLMHDRAQRTAIGHPALDAFRHQLVGCGLFLEIAIGRAALHRA